MQSYIVGGWVRDFYCKKLLGMDLPQGDRDWVVVGATPSQMLGLGFTQVGKDFPVFLHPQTHEEYALARQERKIARGYHGFEVLATPAVTLDEDLLRRDLTINAMAWKEGELIDPYGGLEDLKNKTLRHVSEAFAEDPVRILRLARFHARFPNFKIAPETLALMQGMVNNGEADALVAERVFQELKKGLREICPSKMIEALCACGFWARIFPSLPLSTWVLDRLDAAAQQGFSFEERFAILCSGFLEQSALESFLQALKAPNDISELCLLYHRAASLLISTDDAQQALKVLELCDVLRRPERFESLLNIVHLCHNINKARWLKLLTAFKSVEAGVIAQSLSDKKAIPEAIRQARLEQLRKEFL